LPKFPGKFLPCWSISLEAFSDSVHDGGERVSSQLVPDNPQAEQVKVTLLRIGQLVEMLNSVNDSTVSTTSGCLDLDGSFGPLEVVP
jgi:hypothetical protein